MPVGSILTVKEQASTVQPLLLATITFHDGAVLRLATHDITGGVQYAGNSYLPRIVNKEIAASQALSEHGIDIPASVNLRLSDADYYLWSNFERQKGFKGAKLELRAVAYDAVAKEFSSDSRVIFRGICKEPGGRLPSHDGKVLSVGFFSRLGMADISLPPIRVQKTCPWSFPQTASDRQKGADDSKSEFYPCGYSPDATGGNARGNLNGGVPFVTCNFTKEDCVARGMFSKDSSNRTTARFGGIQWNPPQAQTVREYVTGKWVSVAGGSNEARYGDNIPMLWGTAWTDPLILNTVPDGNFLQFEALICFGEVSYIHEVVVNDVKIPHTYNDGEMPSVPKGISNNTEAARGGWWIAVNRGDRDGANDPAYMFTEGGTPVSDPYGSYCVIRVAVPRKLADAGSVPRVRVLATRGSDNPAHQIKEILEQWVGWDASELNSGYFDDAANVGYQFVNYTTQFGATSTRRRFTSSLYLRQRESAAEVVRGLRNCMRGVLGPDENGLLRLRVKQTLADQHPAVVQGSNYTPPVPSKRATNYQVTDGTAANGYAAYRFDESNILETPQVTLTTAGNRYNIQFQNADNRYSWDAFSPIDSEDTRRSDQEIPASFPVKGADNYDQLYRLIGTYSAEQFRGNWRGDTGGTLVFEFPVSFRGVHLSVGDLCLLNWEPLGVLNQPVRVIRIQPASNFETARFAVAWHSDDWYLDSWGQQGMPRPASPHRNRLIRPAFSWLPFGQQPEQGDSLFGRSEWNFKVGQKYEKAADGTAIAKVYLAGRQITNVTLNRPEPPFVPIQGSTANTGGNIPGGRAYYVAFASCADGKLSGLSSQVTIGVPAGTNTNTLIVNGIGWDAGATGYVVFGGRDPNCLSAQPDESGNYFRSGTPGSVTITSLTDATWGVPDGEFDRYRFRVKRVLHAGLWGAEIAAVTANTIRIAVPEPGFTVNEYAGYDLAWLGQKGSDDPLPIAHFRVQGNTADTLTLAAGAPDPDALGMDVGDVVVMLSRPTFGTDGNGSYIEDPAWQSCFYPDGLSANEEGRLLRFIAGTCRSQVVRIKGNTATRLYADFAVQPDLTSRYVVEEPGWQVISDTAAINNDDPAAEMNADIDVNNYKGQTLLVQALTLDGGDTESVEATSPIRIIYLFGSEAAGGFSSAVALDVAGTLAIGSDLCPRASLLQDSVARAVKAEVKTAPTGADLTVKLYLGTTLWLTLTIPAGATSVTATPAAVEAAEVITAGTNIRVDVTAVGTTFPGSDLSVFIYL
ncbi:MAG: hypothetical protein IT168_33325 [Bryobacterales bacterium]|nr:hypothetical protein [Bryobacterales bacterium]